jgi:hypothetical protein
MTKDPAQFRLLAANLSGGTSNSLKEKLIKIGAKVVNHRRYVVFQMAEVGIPRQMFQDSAADRGTTAAATTRASIEAFDCHAFKRNRQKECVQMPVKIARSAPRPSFGARAAGSHPHLVRQSCCKAGKARIFTRVGESSGESRVSLLACA